MVTLVWNPWVPSSRLSVFPTKIARGTIGVSDLKLVEAGNKVGASRLPSLNLLNISPFTYGILTIAQVYENESVFGMMLTSPMSSSGFSPRPSPPSLFLPGTNYPHPSLKLKPLPHQRITKERSSLLPSAPTTAGPRLMSSGPHR